MPDSQQTIFSLTERLNKAKNDYRKKNSLEIETTTFFKNKLQNDGNIIKSLNKSLDVKEKLLSNLQASFQVKKNEITKRIEGDFSKEIESLRSRESNLKNKLDHVNKEIDQLTKDQSGINLDGVDDTKTLNIKLERLKEKNSELKKLIKEERLKTHNLEKKLEEDPDEESEVSKKDNDSVHTKINSETETEKAHNYEIIKKKKTLFRKFKGLIEVSNKIITGHYEGTEILRAMKEYKEIIFAEEAEDKFFKKINEPFIDNILKRLGAYAKKYELKIDQADKDNIEVKLKNQKLEMERAKSKQDLENAIQKSKANTGEFVGGGSFFVSFSDVMSVLLCFFVVFFAIADHDAEKFDEFFSTWPSYGEVIRENIPKPLNASLSEKELELMNTVKQLVEDNINPESLVRSDTKTIEYVISASDLFATGEIELLPKGTEILKQTIENELKVGGIKQIIIEGHTDDKELTASPKALLKYQNNLEFSAARAGAVAQTIVKKLRFPKKLIIVSGYGFNRPLKPSTSKNYRNLNRRIIIKILKDNEIEEAASDRETTQNVEETVSNQNLTKKN